MDSPTIRRVIAVILLIFMPGWVFAQSEGEACLDHSALIEVDLSALSFDMACDDIGRAYILGISGIPTILQDDGSIEDYAYYSFVRFFLLGEKLAVSDADKKSAYVRLLLASMVIPDQQVLYEKSSVQISQLRANYYRAFILNKYWQYNNLGSADAESVVDANASLLGAQQLSGQQVFCFVEVDIPTLMVEQIVSSSSYNSCISEWQR